MEMKRTSLPVDQVFGTIVVLAELILAEDPDKVSSSGPTSNETNIDAKKPVVGFR